MREGRQRALQLLEQVDIAEHARKYPTALSGGQQQRLAIARAMANDPAILVADEPTGSLDSGTATTVIDLFADLVRQGRTVLLVTHDKDVAKRGSRIVTLADGEIINVKGTEVSHA
jgi:putative ABC transport system ATP-binding protein